MKRITPFILSFILLICAGCSQTNEKTSKTTSSLTNQNNIANADNITSDLTTEEKFSMVSDDKNIYYISDDSILKIDRTTKEKTTILPHKENISLSRLVLFQNKLYYHLSDETYHFEIRSISSNGQENALVLGKSDLTEHEYINGCSFDVIDEKIYIKVGLELFSYNIASKEKTKLLDDVSYYQIAGDFIYYIDDAERTFTIYKKDLQNGKTEILLGDGNTKIKGSNSAAPRYKNLCICNDILYYCKLDSESEGIYKYDGEKEILVFGSAHIDESSIGVYGNSILFVTKNSEKWELTKYDVTTGKTTVLSKLENYCWYYDVKNSMYFYRNEQYDLFSVKI